MQRFVVDAGQSTFGCRNALPDPAHMNLVIQGGAQPLIDLGLKFGTINETGILEFCGDQQLGCQAFLVA